MAEDILLKINKIEVHNAEIKGILTSIDIKMQNFADGLVLFKENLDKYGCMSGKERGEKLSNKIDGKVSRVYGTCAAVATFVLGLAGLIYKLK